MYPSKVVVLHKRIAAAYWAILGLDPHMLRDGFMMMRKWCKTRERHLISRAAELTAKRLHYNRRTSNHVVQFKLS